MADEPAPAAAFELEPASEPAPAVFASDAEPAPPEDPTSAWAAAAPPQFEDAVPVDAEAAVAEWRSPKMWPQKKQKI